MPSTQYFIDRDGKEIGEQEFLAKWHAENPAYSAIKYIAKDSGMVMKLSHETYKTYQVAYKPLHKYMEAMMGRKLSNNSIFLLDFTFKNDYCTSSPPNEWSKSRLNHRFGYINSNRKIIEKEFENLVYSKLFEKGIELPMFSDKQKEVLFIDHSGFFRQNFFRNPTLCGSYALIKPNGEMLIRNGEYGITGIAEHLKPENWNLFFRN